MCGVVSVPSSMFATSHGKPGELQIIADEVREEESCFE